LKVAFVEKEHFGGTCLNVGCTPTKAYVASARRMFDAQHGSELGINIPSGASVDLAKVKARKDSLIKPSNKSIQEGVEKHKNITVFQGSAAFSGPKTIVVNDQELTAEQIYINVGGRSRMPNGFEGVDAMNSSDILNLTEIPEHLIIVGGSYIGLEFGQIFSRFGSRVTVIEMGSRIIGREDEETSDSIKSFMEDEGVEFRLNATCLSGTQDSSRDITVKVDCALGAPEITGTHLLLAVGRVPNTDTLNLESAGVETNKRGFINVNDYLETNVKGIFALGDCNGKGAFTHTAYNDYEIIAENMFEGKDRKVSDRILTYGLFVDPPLGRAGMTLQQAKESGRKIMYGHRPMKMIARAKEKGETKGFMSIVVDAETERILGATVLGIGGDEIISSILNIMYADQAYTVIRDSIQPHPTVSELIPTMLEGLKYV